MSNKLIRITANTPAGERALRMHLADWDQPTPERIREKQVMEKLGISQHITNEDPLIVEVQFGGLSTGRRVKLYKMVQEIDKTMQENGATRRDDGTDKKPDYTVECEK